jgi:chromosome segregation ATPase
MQARIPRPVSGVALSLVLFLAAAICSSEARADTESDRLRDALRNATAQTRALEDARAASQAKLNELEKEKAALKAQLDAAKAEVKKLDQQQREAVEQFNQRLTERDETLDKWKSAYEEAANVARAKDAERAKFEGEANAYKASTKNCVAKNTQLQKVGGELLHQYEQLTVGDMLVAHEPMFQARRVEFQNFLQDSKDKILDQKVTP